MANPLIIKCQPHSLLEHVRGPGGQGGFTPFHNRRFFYADFTLGQMNDLVQRDNPNSNFAGLCIVTGFEGTPIPTEVVYAFRVEWDGHNLVRSPELDIPIITSASIPEIPPAANPQVLPIPAAKGEITWKQPQNADFSSEGLAFVFIDAFTITKLLADVDAGTSTEALVIRIRKTGIRSRIKDPDSNAVEYTPKFLNYIVESIPTFIDKTEPPPPPNTITDEDVLAYDYGYPCPPIWVPENDNAPQNVIAYGIIHRKQVILVANGVAIEMGTIVDALWNNTKAKALLRNWNLNTVQKSLRVEDFIKGANIV